MGRTVGVMFLAIVVALATMHLLPASAAPRSEPSRVVEMPYRTPAIGTADSPTYRCVFPLGIGCVSFAREPGDNFAVIEVKDATEGEVSAAFGQYVGDTQFYNEYVCTSTEKPIKIPRFIDWLSVVIFAGPCKDGTTATATAGTVQFTFYKAKP